MRTPFGRLFSKLFLPLIYCATLFFSSIPGWAQVNNSVSLNGTWQFKLAANEDAADQMAGFYKPGFVAQSFRPIPVPANWAIMGFEPPHYKPYTGDASQGFYLYHFTPPAALQGKRILLHFGGVWSSAEVWLNGKPLGRHDSGYTSFAYDVTSSLHADGDNLLAVRVRQVQHDYLFDTNDDWTLGGIYRDVTLEAMPKDRWLDRVDIQTVFDDQYQDADLKIRAMVSVTEDRGVKLAPYSLQLTLLNAKGEAVQRMKVDVLAHMSTGRDFNLKMHVQSPLHWTAETPNLYTLKVDLLEGGQPAHERVRQVGFRQISTSGGIFRVNGQGIKLRGVNRHDEYPDVGRATTPENWQVDIALMKAANINFIRTSHYPPAEGFLDLCDKLGMYVDDEVPMGGGGDHADDPSFNSAVMLRSYETVARDLNHPSIVLWSIGNEDPLTSLHMASIRTVKALDPTRPVLMPWRANDWLPEEIDILAPHYSTAPFFDELGGRSTRPIVATEFTHAYGTDGFGGLEDRWKALTRHPSGTGGAIWMWAEQGINVIKRQKDGTEKRELILNQKDGVDGITDSYRKPQRDYWETKAVYAQVYPSVDKIDLAFGQSSVRIPIQNDFDFTDLKTVQMHWEIREDDRSLDSGDANVKGQPHATAWLDIPTTSLATIKAGATYYIWITFRRDDGSEITKRTVELSTKAAPQPVATAFAPPVVTAVGDELSVVAGDVTYVFDSRAGQLTEARVRQVIVLSNLRPSIWRPLTHLELNLSAKEGLEDPPDLDVSRSSVSEWKATPRDGALEVRATVKYTIDKQDSFVADELYLVRGDGTLKVQYKITPEVRTKMLPLVGFSSHIASEYEELRWLGLGPVDAFPNERAAAFLGVWSGALGSSQIVGTKATRWFEMNEKAGAPFRIVNGGYIVSDARDGHEIKIASQVNGRMANWQLPDYPTQQLRTGDGRSFSGEFSFIPHP